MRLDGKWSGQDLNQEGPQSPLVRDVLGTQGASQERPGAKKGTAQSQCALQTHTGLRRVAEEPRRGSRGRRWDSGTWDTETRSLESWDSPQGKPASSDAQGAPCQLHCVGKEGSAYARPRPVSTQKILSVYKTLKLLQKEGFGAPSESSWYKGKFISLTKQQPQSEHLHTENTHTIPLGFT